MHSDPFFKKRIGELQEAKQRIAELEAERDRAIITMETAVEDLVACGDELAALRADNAALHSAFQKFVDGVYESITSEDLEGLAAAATIVLYKDHPGIELLEELTALRKENKSLRDHINANTQYGPRHDD